MKFGMT